MSGKVKGVHYWLRRLTAFGKACMHARCKKRLKPGRSQQWSILSFSYGPGGQLATQVEHNVYRCFHFDRISIEQIRLVPP
jgi:hypothetical protein